MKDFITPASELLNAFGSDGAAGLTDAQAAENRRKYGENALTRKKPDSLLRRIWAAATEPMLLLLVAAGIIALGVNIFRGATGGEADYLECAGIFVAIGLSVAISVAMEGRSAKAFEALSRISDNIVIRAVRNGEVVMLSQKELAVGDVLLLGTGDKVPADGRLLESTELSADESALTGESVPAQKDAAQVYTDEKTPLAERSNMLYGGTYVTGGTGRLLVTAVGDATEFGRIAGELGGGSKGQTPLQEKLARLGKIITILGVAAAAVVFAAQLVSFAGHGGLEAEEVLEAFLTSIVLIVAAVPEGLPTIMAVSLSINIIKLSRQNALVKKMIASETVGCINVICSDKTGTLTENRMSVRSFYDTALRADPAGLTSLPLIRNICLNSTADLGSGGQFIGNPTECALLTFYERSEGRDAGRDYREERAAHPALQVFPFTSELKHMTTLTEIGGKVIAFTKGSPEAVIAMCAMTPESRADAEAHIAAAQREAMRVIGFAHRELPAGTDWTLEEHHREMESGMVFDGFTAISDPLRAEVYGAVEACRSAGIDLKILTGDNLVTAAAIAGELHLLGEGRTAVEAREIAELSDAELSRRLDDICVIARSTPGIKMRVVKLLKAKGCVVAVTGDGINDAPALKNADVGIAMGISGTEVSKEASDIVLLDDSFATIVRAVEWGRNIYENFKRFISFQLTVNFSSVAVVLVSILLGLKAPFTALELLWINMIMDGPPALTLGLEPNYSDLMSRAPTRRDENILSRSMLTRIVLTGTYISAVFLGQYLFNFLHVAPGQQSTVLFTLFVLFQLFNSFNCRELHSGSIFRHLLSNRLMLAVVGATFVLQVLIIQFAGAFFGTVPLSLALWGKLFVLSGSVVLLSELVRLALRLLRAGRERAGAPQVQND